MARGPDFCRSRTRFMKIVMPGGSGQIGALLARHLAKQGYEVVILSRGRACPVGRVVPWDAEHLGDWAVELEGADVVINLAGRSVNCRYSRRNRREILASRINSTRLVGQAIALAKDPPRLWLQAGTATIYAHRFDAANDEDTGILGGGEKMCVNRDGKSTRLNSSHVSISYAVFCLKKKK